MVQLEMRGAACIAEGQMTSNMRRKSKPSRTSITLLTPNMGLYGKAKGMRPDIKGRKEHGAAPIEGGKK